MLQLHFLSEFRLEDLGHERIIEMLPDEFERFKVWKPALRSRVEMKLALEKTSMLS